MTDQISTADLTDAQTAEVAHIVESLGAPDAQAAIDEISQLAQEDGVTFAEELDQADMVASLVDIMGDSTMDAGNDDDVPEL